MSKESVYVLHLDASGKEVSEPVWCGYGRAGRREASRVAAFRKSDDLKHDTYSVIHVEGRAKRAPEVDA